MKLHEAKKYSHETLFTAIGILDRYLAKMNYWTESFYDHCQLSVISLLIAAKMK